METKTSNAPPAEETSNLPPFSCLYFGFASNLSPRTLQQRCPGSLYVGLAALEGWKFIIAESGFGNIVPTGDCDDVVYGTLHFLTAQHEAALDKSEEIDWWHVKRKVKVRRIELDSQGKVVEPAATGGGEQYGQVEATTYVDVERTTPGIMSKEYIVFIRKAIEDGLRCGVPQAYFDRYWKQYLPEDEMVGREEKIVMLRTIQMDKENTKYVPNDVLKLATKQ
ncbi:uncharacterized protein Z519_05543 [Cladophialophora bantiana CBS 173.52]|uniref:gamma-glutamylcyclotransferase n=1 Tax=Cladophialophora bantiana (strain ATCC 10958 / CBS 173.52 / CDC B-1940 / NIH 8579) TaxID=1442370 RepID=A0A0D2G6J3_CLAB1|nr:uncharacterized protein Z519_05543 [Cladophialophora bantiana CBS 173.52]KIW94227.1 hypothetical protein Z519_05543 [Cladophialophora bantiana CBS 173.52]